MKAFDWLAALIFALPVYLTLRIIVGVDLNFVQSLPLSFTSWMVADSYVYFLRNRNK